jgi:hypothetical protein
MEPESTQKSEGESTNIPVNVVNSTPPSADSQTKAADEPQPEPSTPPASASPTPIVSKDKDPRRRRKLLLIGGLIIVLAAAGAAYWVNHNHKVTAPKVTVIKRAHKSPTKVQGLQLDEKKNYGDKYANGLLPVGDSKYSSATAQKGTVYVCSAYESNLKAGGGGASARGPWFTSNNTQYDVNKKSHIAGSVSWQSSFSNSVSGATRNIVTNDLPTHVTGVFPVAASDPAYAYDRNPNTIKSQSLAYALSSSPVYGNPNCMGGQVGVMLTGVALFNGFDAGGRDAGAWEVQDSCSGHPEKQGEYHYHTLSSCIKDTSVHTVIGYALDGFPITGPQVGAHNILTTTDLDECHGLTSTVALNGKTTTTYHYVMTQDFPYSASCFRGQAIQPPGMPSGPKP